jgi:GMP synthase (glutamine-hydrolysing)
MSKPLKILLIDNSRDLDFHGNPNIVRWILKSVPEGSELMVRRSMNEDLPSIEKKFDAIVLSGSGTSCMETKEAWIAPYDQFVSTHMDRHTPILGICYGMQTLARCQFRKNGETPALRKADHAELGWVKIHTTDKNDLFEGIDPDYFTYQSHYEEVSGVPAGMRVFAESEHCKIQALELVGEPIYGVQFHPEYGVDQAEKSLAEKKKKGERAEWIFNAGKGTKLYNESVGKNIFGNFFKLAAR